MYNRHLRLSYLLRLLRNCLHELHDLALAVADDCFQSVSLLSPFAPQSQTLVNNKRKVLTSPSIAPIYRHRALKSSIILLELAQRIARARRALNHTASLRRTQVFQDTAQLVGSRSSFLNICIPNQLLISQSSILKSLSSAISMSFLALSHTKLKLRPLQLALLAMIARLILGGMRNGSRIQLLEEGMHACRDGVLRRVEEGNDILDAGLDDEGSQYSAFA